MGRGGSAVCGRNGGSASTAAPLPILSARTSYQADEKALASATQTQAQLKERAATLRTLVSEQAERAKAAKLADVEVG